MKAFEAHACTARCDHCGRPLRHRHFATRLCWQCEDRAERNVGNDYFAPSALVSGRCGVTEDDYSEESRP